MNSNQSDRLNAAKSYLALGWQPIPIPPKRKGPVIDDWRNFRVNGNLNAILSGPGNIGVLLGEPSGG